MVVAADWGAWSEWSPSCLCSHVVLRSRECEAEPCAGDETQTGPCTCVPTNPPGEYWHGQVKQRGKIAGESRMVFRTNALKSLPTVRHTAGSLVRQMLIKSGLYQTSTGVIYAVGKIVT